MRIYRNFVDMPKNKIYLGSENRDGSMYMALEDEIGLAIEPVCFRDEDGVRHYFDLSAPSD